MKLIDMEVKGYLEVLKSDAPAPGGGSVSALAGAQGAALCAMVCDLTVGKEKYAADWAICEETKERSEELYHALMEAVDKDTEAFMLVSDAFKLPKDTDEAKAKRSKAIADATVVATEVPYRSMELAFSGLEQARNLIGHSNVNAASDLGVAVLNFLACIKGAWLNVKINLPGVKDEALAGTFKDGGEKICEEAEAIARTLFNEIEKSL